MVSKNTDRTQNQNAEIRTRIDRTGKFRTETHRRDDGTVSIAVSTNTANNSTKMFIDMPDGDTYKIDGRTARTIYRMLQKHYRSINKTW